MKAKSGKDMAEELARFANNYVADQTGFVQGLYSEHRTLQQSVMRLFIAWVREMANDFDRNSYDLRNEATVRLAKKIVELGERNLYLPEI